MVVSLYRAYYSSISRAVTNAIVCCLSVCNLCIASLRGICKSVNGGMTENTLCSVASGTKTYHLCKSEVIPMHMQWNNIS